MNLEGALIGQDDLVLVTGSTGFIGSRVVEALLHRGFRNVRCFARPSSDVARLDAIASRHDGARVDVIKGNLLSRQDCLTATRDAALVLHLAAGTSGKSFPDAVMNSVVTTRNLLDATLSHKRVRRFVNVSSFAVYSNAQNRRGRRLDEASPVESHPELRGDPYCFAKVKQDELVADYGKRFGVPCVIVRPGCVYGPGKSDINGRIGIGTFGIFLHLGGSNTIPFTYVDNCADAIVLAGLTPGIDGEVFNIVDDNLPSSRQYLRWYKKNVRRFRSIYVPHAASHALCYMWERYSIWSEGQLPPVFNRRRWHAFWKKARYSNDKLKSRLGWAPTVPISEGFKRYSESYRAGRHA
jgi:nucleoside-diphosphate-sugar epimerase